ncbi:MAG: hypothetical protein AAFY26_14530 [Cyanobacteria bacterium J06638_22]
MALTPKAGLVVRYDFLWKDEALRGQEHGRKDRPCAIILATSENEDGSREVILCAISHTPPSADQHAVEVPAKVAAHLGFDGETCWIKTHEVNTLTWESGRIPFGISEAHKGHWSFGMLPQQLTKRAFEQLRFYAQRRVLTNVKRDKDDRKR